MINISCGYNVWVDKLFGVLMCYNIVFLLNGYNMFCFLFFEVCFIL